MAQKLTKIPEDKGMSAKNIFVVADGVTHDVYDDNNLSDSSSVASIVCNSIITKLSNTKVSLLSIKSSFLYANDQVRNFNQKSIR